MRKLIVIFMVILLSGCYNFGTFSPNSIFAPKPFRMGKPDKNADPIYTKGWNDGCQTGMSTMIQGYYKSFYKYAQDPELVEDKMYYQAWKDSYTYCRQYAFRMSWDPIDKAKGNKGFDNPLCILCPNEFDR